MHVWDADARRLMFGENNYENYWTFVYDVTAGIPAVIEEVLPGESARYYFREPNGSLIASKQGTTSPVWRYYHFDELGNTRALTDEDGDVTDTYDYDAWGNVTHLTGSTNQPYQYVGRLGYYTHYQDPEFNMLQLGIRFYNPDTSTFSQQDPMRRSWDAAYDYAYDRPLSLVDPLGLFNMFGDLDIDWDTGRTSCTCKLEIVGQDIPSDIIDNIPDLIYKPGVDMAAFEKTIPLSGRCEREQRCWPWDTKQKDENKKRRAQRKAYKDCLADSCGYLCEYDLPGIGSTRGDWFKSRDTWHARAKGCYDQQCK